MGTTPILEMARAYGLHPRLWLLVPKRTIGSFSNDDGDGGDDTL